MEILGNQAFLSLIAGLIGVGVRYFAKMASSLQEISIKMGAVVETQKDHEVRLRLVEKHTKIKGA